MNGVVIAYAEQGHGSPVVFLHGGFANGDYWAAQATALARHHRVVVIDSRGQGRSGVDQRPLSYDLLADDVAALLDRLGIARAGFVGWSDGGIVALDLAMRYPRLIDRVFTLGANVNPSGLDPAGSGSDTFRAYRQRVAREHTVLAPDGPPVLKWRARLNVLGATDPDWPLARLRGIEVPVLVAIGDHDEVIRRDHAERIAAALPDARLLVLPGTSHFALLQAPALLTAAIDDFFDTPPR